ncbi:hypothetical protein HPB50_009310 [Hyalomma asiaticum]|uniref:Uncharacterized protein n=1 Tax=Hyalomma asiaticum TaxID=266040 RepID=A0ACB7THC0_HYAAI|nr:hypothetical protein HPB50_009310 [Hyalomma asiaticum]
MPSQALMTSANSEAARAPAGILGHLGSNPPTTWCQKWDPWFLPLDMATKDASVPALAAASLWSPAPFSFNDVEVDKALFFVYCKQPCDRVLPGKLRVCCAFCGEGSFILQKDPSCWKDVLEPDQLLGQCQICHQVRPARFFFKCTGTAGSHDDQVPIVLQLIRYNYLRVPCLACLDVR